MDIDSSNVFDNVEIKKEGLCSQIADKIQNIIRTHGLKPGTKLPPERELAAQLKVNRNTLREAIRTLQQRGLLDMRQGSGTFVATVPVNTVSETIKLFSALGQSNKEDLMQLREILEPAIAGIAAQKATAEEIQVMENHMKIIEQSLKDDSSEEFIDADLLFHEAIAKSTHNELMYAIFKGLKDDMYRQRRNTIFHIYKKNVTANRKVLEAIQNRDSSKAKQAMVEHMKLAHKSLSIDK